MLAKEDVAGWILSKAEAEGPFTVFLIVPLPPGDVVKIHHTDHGFAVFPAKPLTTSKDWPAVGTEVDMVAFPVEGTRARRMPVAKDGTLERLRILSETLAGRYGWQSFEATRFILTNVPPVIPSLTVQYDEKDISVLSRVKLTIDPALSPREVAEGYRQARKRYFAGRHRSMSDKHTMLVLFMNSRPAEETYAESMAAWNREHRKRKWRYDRVTNFGRDVQVARRRLLGSDPKAQQPSLPGHKGKKS